MTVQRSLRVGHQALVDVPENPAVVALHLSTQIRNRSTLPGRVAPALYHLRARALIDRFLVPLTSVENSLTSSDRGRSIWKHHRGDTWKSFSMGSDSSMTRTKGEISPQGNGQNMSAKPDVTAAYVTTLRGRGRGRTSQSARLGRPRQDCELCSIVSIHSGP